MVISDEGEFMLCLAVIRRDARIEEESFNLAVFMTKAGDIIYRNDDWLKETSCRGAKPLTNINDL